MPDTLIVITDVVTFALDFFIEKKKSCLMSDNVVAQFSYLLNQRHEMATISYKILYYYTLLNIVDCLRKFYVN